MNHWNWPTQPKDVDPETRLSLIANSTENPATPAFLVEPVDHLPDLVLRTQHPQDHWNLPSPRSVYDQTFGSHHSTGLRPRYPRRQIPLSNLALLAQRPFDRLRGLDFLGVVDTGTLGLNPKLVHRSSPSGGRGLARLLSSCGVSRDDAMLDVGCGKGNALRTMQRQPFACVDGLELAPELVAVARTNFGRLGSRHVRPLRRLLLLVPVQPVPRGGHGALSRGRRGVAGDEAPDPDRRLCERDARRALAQRHVRRDRPVGQPARSLRGTVPSPPLTRGGPHGGWGPLYVRPMRPDHRTPPITRLPQSRRLYAAATMQ